MRFQSSPHFTGMVEPGKAPSGTQHPTCLFQGSSERGLEAPALLAWDGEGSGFLLYTQRLELWFTSLFVSL